MDNKKRLSREEQIVGSDGEYLFAGSAIGFDDHIEGYKKGKRGIL